jgi:UDP-glucose:(heptosyl)LPS alpha-1,3-glucosyltransferase
MTAVQPVKRLPTQLGPAGCRPRIALVAHGIHDDGGMERAFAELVRRAHTQFDFTVFSSELAPDLRRLVDWRPTRVPARPIPLRLLTFFLRVSVPLARTHVELVHSLGAIAPNHADVVTVQYCHAGSLAKTGRLAPRGATRLRTVNRVAARMMAIAAERFSYRPARVRLFASVSEGIADELEEHYPGIPISITPNGVDLDRFKPDPECRVELREAQGVGDDVVCLFVGGDWDRKGLGLVISALAEVRNEHQIRLWVVGRGDVNRFLRLAEELHVADRISFFGPCRDTERFYQAADIFVLPTEYEAAPLVAYEASACGLPVVATCVNGITDLVVDGETGVLVTRTSDDIARALLVLAADPDLRRRMGEAARRRASAFTWDRSAASVVRVYEQLLHQTLLGAK